MKTFLGECAHDGRAFLIEQDPRIMKLADAACPYCGRTLEPAVMALDSKRGPRFPFAEADALPVTSFMIERLRKQRGTK